MKVEKGNELKVEINGISYNTNDKDLHDILKHEIKEWFVSNEDITELEIGEVHISPYNKIRVEAKVVITDRYGFAISPNQYNGMNVFWIQTINEKTLVNISKGEFVYSLNIVTIKPIESMKVENI